MNVIQIVSACFLPNLLMSVFTFCGRVDGGRRIREGVEVFRREGDEGVGRQGSVRIRKHWSVFSLLLEGLHTQTINGVSCGSKRDKLTSHI
jgi:hypothetical protein